MLATLDVPYVDTKATDLAWTLDHPVLAALAMVTVAPQGATVELRVLGASHQVVLSEPDGDLVETVACLPGRPAHLPGTVERRVGRRTYRFQAHVDSLTAADVSVHADTLRAMAASGGSADADAVVAAFPSEPDAVTALRARAHPGGVAWDTWHLYPGSRQLVTTSTEVVR